MRHIRYLVQGHRAGEEQSFKSKSLWLYRPVSLSWSHTDVEERPSIAFILASVLSVMSAVDVSDIALLWRARPR